MENDRFRKKVFMQTEHSTLINGRLQLIPRWVGESEVMVVSAYELWCYSMETEGRRMVERGGKEGEILLADYRQDDSNSHCEMYYLYQDNSSYFLVHRKFNHPTPLLIHKRQHQHKSVIVEKFLDYIIRTQEGSNPTLPDNTHQLIDQLHDNPFDENTHLQYDITAIRDLLVVFECSFALMLVQMRKINGIMLVNIHKATSEDYKEYKWSMMDLDQPHPPQLNSQDSQASKLIYLFPETVVQMHRTSDITQFVVLTKQHILLLKVNYELMELCLLHKLQLHQHSVLSLSINTLEGRDFIVALVESQKEVSIRNLKGQSNGKKILKLLKIQERKITEVENKPHYRNCLRYESQQQKTLRFLDEGSEGGSPVCNQSRYLISQCQVQQFNNNKNMIMNVFSSMLSEEGHTQEKIEFERHIHNAHFKEDRRAHTNFHTTNAIKHIGGVASNKHLVVIWERDESALHLCRVVSEGELGERLQREREESLVKTTNKLIVKEKEIKDMYAQLMGNHHPRKEQNAVEFRPRIEYVRRVDLEGGKVVGVSLSPNNENMLIVAESKESYTYSLLQLELLLQLANPDPTIFIKPMRSILRNKPTECIAVSLVKEMPLFLSGNLIHSLENELLQGVLSFDIHPYHLFLAVSFGFSTKIYALEGNERVSSLHSSNVQGVKQVKYSHMGNHLCLLSSKSIRIIDAYSFALKFVLTEKNSTFSKCFYSSDALEFHTISENHVVSVYNTFDYARMDLIRPTHPEYRPLSLRSYCREKQICMVLENGSLLVRYKPEAIVVAHEIVLAYMDQERIVCIEIDEKNGILFAGCASGRLRAHIWPLREDMNFEKYSQIRVGFTPIVSMALSNLHHNLYAGSADGNTSKVKFIIDRSLGSGQGQEGGRFVFTQNSLNYATMSSNHCLEKVYRFVLSNPALAQEEVPEKARLEYKLSEVIGKLGEEMARLKEEIREEIEEKSRLAKRKFDVNLFHHLNKIITTQLNTQYQDALDTNSQHLHHLTATNQQHLNTLISQQNQLLQHKSFIISANVAQRNALKEQHARDYNALLARQEAELKKLTASLAQTQVRSRMKEEEGEHFPSYAYDYEEELALVRCQLQGENRRYLQLRKECAYKETAMREMGGKKVREESLELKFQIETGEMGKKRDYNAKVVEALRGQMEQAEEKVHQMQMQATIIKNSAQFKKIVKVDQMNDACSYKLWTKDRIENEIEELTAHLKLVEECLQAKSTQMVELIFDKNQKIQLIASLQRQLHSKRERLKASKVSLLQAKNRLRVHKPERQSFRPHLSSRQREASVEVLLSSREVAVNKDVSLFNSIMDKEMNSLRTTMKIHRRKLNNFGKENGELLAEFQKLKYEHKELREEVEVQTRRTRTIRKDLTQDTLLSPSNIHIALGKTSFQKYIQSKNRDASRFRTAANTPSATPPNFD